MFKEKIQFKYKIISSKDKWEEEFWKWENSVEEIKSFAEQNSLELFTDRSKTTESKYHRITPSEESEIDWAIRTSSHPPKPNKAVILGPLDWTFQKE